MHDETRCVTATSIDSSEYQSLTVPVHRASTITYPNADSFMARRERGPDSYIYGLYGTPTHRHLERKLTELHKAARTVLVPSGQAAISMVMLHVLDAGDSVLIPETAYGPVHDFARSDLRRLGVEAIFYDPEDLQQLERLLLKTRAKLVWVETPGSLTMKMQDLPAIVKLAQAHGAQVGCDNTWASPLNFRPLTHGADFAVEALSKHIGGHADLLLGSISVKDEAAGVALKAMLGRMGIGVSPDDCVLAMRGLETLAVRLRHCGENGVALAHWLQDQPNVRRVLHPALPDFSGHEIWKRDYSGAAGVFSVEFVETAVQHMPQALDALSLIAIGASWGGTKSLAAPVRVSTSQHTQGSSNETLLLRLSVGLENLDDLKQDLTRFLDRIHALARAPNL